MQNNSLFSSVIIGDDRLSIMCAEFLVAQKQSLTAFVSESPNAKVWADQHNIPYFHDLDNFVNSPLSKNFDYLFSIVNAKILPTSVLKMPNKLAINYHDAPLPKYAGIHATSWALLNGETQHAVSWHIMTTEVDSGDILLQAPVSIEPSDTAFTLNLKCHQQAFTTFKKLIRHLATNETHPQPQDLSQRTYFGHYHPIPNQGIVDWNTSAEEIDRLCRALDFGNQPNALGSTKFLLDDEFYIIDKHELAPSSGQNPGTVSNISDKFIQIATQTKDIRLINIKDNCGRIIPIVELIKKYNIQKSLQLHTLPHPIFEKIDHDRTKIIREESFWIETLEKIQPFNIPFLGQIKNNIDDEHFNSEHYKLENLTNTYHTEKQSLVILSALLAHFYRLNNCESFSIALTHPEIEQYCDTEYLGLFSSWAPFNINIDPEKNFDAAISNIKNHYDSLIQHKTFQNDIFSRYPNVSKSMLPIHISIDKKIEHNRDTINILIDSQKANITLYFEKNFTDIVKKIMHSFDTFLSSILEIPQNAIKSHSLLTQAEYQKIIFEWNQTHKPRKKDDLVHHLFEQQVIRSPDSVALIFENQEFTYAELNKKANQLAHYITKIVKTSNSHIAIYLPRGPETIISMLAILKSGNIYVPIAENAPITQLEEILIDCQAAIILTEKQLAKKISKTISSTIIEIDTNQAAIEAENTNNFSEISVCDKAYVMYTSGSTGKPKGVQVTHYSLINLLLATKSEFEFTPEDVLLAITSTTFDISGLEIYLPLITGSTFVLLSHVNRLDPHEIASNIIKYNITIMQATPATWKMLINIGWKNESNIKILSGGEALNTELATQLKSAGGSLWNLYGPTETTIWSTSYKVEQINIIDGLVPIGKPIDNTKVYVLDQNLQPVPAGIPGTLYIAGDGVSGGYLNKPQLNQKMFTLNPFDQNNESPIIYNTGDLANWSENGNLSYINRVDTQIKIRGLRIELGAIESCLLRHPGITQAAVIYHIPTTGNANLVAYLVTKKNTLDRNKLVDYLKIHLYEYMIPAYFVTLNELPITSNGKINKKVLPKPTRRDLPYTPKLVAPNNKQQLLLTGIWSEILSLPQESIGIEDNFFELGGHSLSAIQAITRINALFSIKLDIRTFFEHATIQELAYFLETIKKEKISLPTLLPTTQENQPEPLAENQQRLWFLSKFHGNSAVYNISAAWKLTGALNKNALEKSILAVIKRQTSLRIFFSSDNGTPEQTIQPIEALNFKLDIKKLNDAPPKEVDNYLKKLAAQPFEMENNPLFRFQLLHLNNEHHILYICIHHIISDGWSLGILYRELSFFYKSYYYDIPITLESLPIQYLDFCKWQQTAYQNKTYQEQITYWQKKLANLSTLEFPTDFPRSAVQTYQGDSINFKIPPELVSGLRDLSQKNNVTLFATLLSAFAILLSRYANQKDIAIGIPIANRSLPETEDIIGFFVNTLVIRLDISQKLSINQLLKIVQSTLLEAQANGNIPFEKVIDVVQPERDQSKSPFFQTMFSYNNSSIENINFSGINSKQKYIKRSFSHLDMSLFLEEKNDLLNFSIEYNTGLFNSETILRVIDNYIYLLSKIKNNPDRHIDKTSILSFKEKKELLINYNNTTKNHTIVKNLIEYIESQVEKNEQKIAMVFQNEQITYGELNNQANKLARFIQHSKIQNSHIAVYSNRNIESIISFLAIMKSGNIYIPIEKETPQILAEEIIIDAKVTTILTDNENFEKANKFSSFINSRIINIDLQKDLINKENSSNLKIYSATELAYVIYTSGSTGKPKGVKIKHSSLLNLLLAMSDEVNITSQDVLLAITPFSFDLSVPDIYLPLITGSKMIIGEPSTRFNPCQIAKDIATHQVTVMQATPTTWQMLINIDWQNTNVKMICGGEGLNTELASQLYNLKNSLWNFYGPTETTVWSTCHKVNHIDPTTPLISIGHPLTNTQLYVLDENLQPVPIGVIGELYIGGDGVAQGYLNNPELTEHLFIPDFFSKNPNQKLYRTGDLVKWSQNGELHYIGRIDNQIKIRGHRIETGAVENILTKHEDIHECVVLDQGPSKEHELVAYIVPAQKTLLLAKILNYLKQILPSYMVPTKFVLTEKFPLTFNGKIDRKNLPNITHYKYLTYETYDTHEENRYETVIVNIIKKLLHLNNINTQTNFFNLGMHSLLMIEFSYILSKELGYQVNVIDLFTYPTVTSLANFLINNETNQNNIEDDSSKNRAVAKLTKKLVKKREPYVN